MTMAQREHKCRGRRTDNGEWVYGSNNLSDLYQGFLLLSSFWEQVEKGLIEPATVGKYTGLKDRSGKPIYEGDIIQWHSLKLLIHWGEHASFMMGKDNMNIGNAEYSEVIGNIHENPELGD